MSTVTRQKIVELIRLLEEMADPPLIRPGEPADTPFNDTLSPIQKATINETVGILKGYLRILIMIAQFRVAFLAFFTHYPELFGEQDERGPFD